MNKGILKFLHIAATSCVIVLKGLLPLASAQLLHDLEQEFQQHDQEEEACTDINVEAQVRLLRTGVPLDNTVQPINFTITVTVKNGCQEPLVIQHGSYITYETNFPQFGFDPAQPPECAGRQRSLSGEVPPMQKLSFVFRAQGCVFPIEHTDQPRVSLETGRIITDQAEKPVPSVTEVLL